MRRIQATKSGCVYKYRRYDSVEFVKVPRVLHVAVIFFKSMYNGNIQSWGWAKYRYRQFIENNFQQAKSAAIKALDSESCPVDVIRRFINRSWR